jgi:hypothetical protein
MIGSGQILTHEVDTLVVFELRSDYLNFKIGYILYNK